MATNGKSIMISINVKVSGENAKLLKAKLQEYVKASVWICTEDLKGGEDYRDGIVRAVKHADVFMILLTEEWAASGECKDEYNFAKRLNLTSHERHITTPEQKRRPVMLPIAFPNLNWDAYPHVELLAASTNFIVHNSMKITPNDNNLLQQICSALVDAGIELLKPLPNTEAPSIPVAPQQPRRSILGSLSGKKSISSPSPAADVPEPKTNSGSSNPDIMQLEEQIQSMMKILSKLKTANNTSPISRKQPKELPTHLNCYEGKLRDHYMGTLVQTYGGRMAWGLETSFDLSPEAFKKLPGSEDKWTLKGEILWELIHFDADKSLPDAETWTKWCQEHLNQTAVEEIEGIYDATKGLLLCKGYAVRDENDLIATDTYRLTLTPDGLEMYGLCKGEDTGSWESIWRSSAF